MKADPATSAAPAGPQPGPEEILELGRAVLEREGAAIAQARANLGAGFTQAVELTLTCAGRVAVTGMGKAGIVGRKIQATLASTGTPSYALHPAEAIHGDLGMIQPEDLILALSNSGESEELVRLFPVFRKFGCRIMLMTGRPRSRGAHLADVVLDIGDVAEACPLGLAPSASTTAMLALGDALALTVMKLRNVSPEQYAQFHPGGALGRSLMRVHEVMRRETDCPQLAPDDPLDRYYDVCASAPRRAGAAAVVDAAGKLVGFFTDGDLRRLHRAGQPLDIRMSAVMTKNPKFASQDDLVADALHTMQRYRIDELPAVDADHRLVGLIDIQDLVAAGFSTFEGP
ncbi:MAG TPA: KpsF/GutQ family sugar-phosphate isomerase [Phycisphaerae bacterium]|nr:KpsF/GutQ family sugar-phosphate isomerase [Phycisphaerales bacterium]HRX86638.1 KpsF/GutQ family sugar-phosphate isomerase [Phycisphaerae bacterium]